MSRAFVKEDAGAPDRRYTLPPRPHVERILADARASKNERLEQLAERFLR